jgi:hypothetical protein
MRIGRIVAPLAAAFLLPRAARSQPRSDSRLIVGEMSLAR